MKSSMPFGPLTSLTYGNGRVLTQTVDSAYRITAQTISGVLTLSYPTYDANGNLTTRTDSGQTEGYTYDALNRLDTATGPFGNRDYGYDTIGSTDVLLDANGNTLNKGSWTFDYTAHNRLKTVTDNGDLKASYAYNGLGQRVGKTLPTGGGRHFLYGQNGELLAETDADGNLLNEYVYLDGQPLAVYQPDDDNDGLSNADEDQIGSNPANTDSDGDGLSNIDEWYSTGTDARDADSDNDGVLDGAEVSAGTDPNNATIYPGDGDVNQDGRVDVGDLVLVMQMATGQRVPTPEQQTHADVYTDGVIDVRDMLKLQRRILGLSLREWFNELPGSQRMLAAIEQAQQAVSDVIAHAQIALIDDAQAAVANGKLYYVHVDHLGTPKALTDEAGVKVWSAVHDPFGQATVNEDPDGNGLAVTFNLRFAGQYADQETGLHDNGFRTYDPNTGRYLESDPIGLVGGLNTYAYVDSNPVTWFDLDGLAKNKNPNANYRLVRCPRKEMGECANICAARGGVKSCAVTRGIRSTVRDGYATREPYTVPGSMSCVCNDDDPEPGSEQSCGDTCQKAATTVVVGGAVYIVYRCVRLLPSLAPPLWWTLPGNLAAP